MDLSMIRRITGRGAAVVSETTRCAWTHEQQPVTSRGGEDDAAKKGAFGAPSVCSTSTTTTTTTTTTDNNNSNSTTISATNASINNTINILIMPFRCLKRTCIDSNTFSVAIRRFLLLAALLAFQSGSQVVLQRYEELIKKHVVLVLFMSVIVGAGGNAANQAALSVITATLTSRGSVELFRSSANCFNEMESKRVNIERGRCNSVSKSPSTLYRTRSSRLWTRLSHRVTWMTRLWKMLLDCRWVSPVSSGGKVAGGGQTCSSVTLSIFGVLRYEVLLGLCCGAVLMCIGALRVGLFLWFDAAEEMVEGNVAYMGASLGASCRDSLALLIALSFSLFLTVLLATVIGAMLPFIVSYCGMNIECTAPIVQVMMDLLGTWLCCVICNNLLPTCERLGH